MRLRELPPADRPQALAARVWYRFERRNRGPWDLPTLRHCHPVMASILLTAFPLLNRPPYNYAKGDNA